MDAAVNGSPARARKRVAILVPMSTRAELTADEQVSLRHLEHWLGRYDRYLLAPESLDVELPGFGVRRFGDRYFGSVAAHTRLLLSRQFYEAFAEYEFMLIYHLDALVFSDQLLEWCGKGYDYVGGPWWDPPSRSFIVGNGGFSLRRIESFLRIFASRRYSAAPERAWETFAAGKPWHVRALNYPRKYLKRLRYFNGVQRDIYHNIRAGANEDTFFAEVATKFNPEFRFAPLAEAIRFAFDNAPRRCFEMNHHELPFGCHGWYKWDRAFWEPYLLPAGGAAARAR